MGGSTTKRKCTYVRTQRVEGEVLTGGEEDTRSTGNLSFTKINIDKEETIKTKTHQHARVGVMLLFLAWRSGWPSVHNI